MMHQGTSGLSPAILAQHQARKERLARFAQAAERQQDKSRTVADIRQAVILETCIAEQPKPVTRREYESRDQPSAYVPLARRILRAVAAEFEMTINEITAQNREAMFCLPRYVAIGLMLELTQLSLPAIGRMLGGRDHSTILNGKKRLAQYLTGEAFRNRFEQLRAGISI